jgi:hypothetical protein
MQLGTTVLFNWQPGASAPATTHGRNTMKLHHLIIDIIGVICVFALPLAVLVIGAFVQGA